MIEIKENKIYSYLNINGFTFWNVYCNIGDNNYKDTELEELEIYSSKTNELIALISKLNINIDTYLIRD